MKSNVPRPPRWPVKLLRFFLKREFVEEIEGDMEEIFYENVESFSLGKAKRIYMLEMIKLLRPGLIRNLGFIQRLDQYGMLKNYFKVSFRGLVRNPVNSFINVFGLAVAIGLFVFAYSFARWTFSTDQFHVNKDKVYLTTFFANRDGVEQQYGTSPRPLGEMLDKDFAQIESVCRVEDRSVVMKHRDNVFHERIRFVDPTFLKMFTFPLERGVAHSLEDLNSIILSESSAKKYFGDQDPINQSIEMIFGKEQAKVFTVSGVAKEFPKARTISFDFLVNFENLKAADPTYDNRDWNKFVNATFVEVDDVADLRSIQSKMEKYRSLQNKSAAEDWAITSFTFEPLATLHIQSEYIKDDIARSTKSNYVSIYFMVIIAVLMLVLACFNYINIAIATAAKRLKEIGLRKSIGATRRAVVIQFLSENFVLTSFALIIGVALGYFFFIPGFESLWNFNMDFSLTDPDLWFYLPALLMVTSIASGIYPAFYISRFQVVAILKGTVKFGRRNTLMRLFLGFQLVFACVFVTMSVMFAQNTNYLSKRSWGYDPSNGLYAMTPDGPSCEKLAALMEQNANVVSVSKAAQHVGKNHQSTVLHFADRNYEVDRLSVDANYFKTLGLELKDGRVFNNFEGSDRHAVVINETLANSLGADALGQTFRIDSLSYEVVGVLKEFHSYKFSQLVRPLVFTVVENEDSRFLVLKAQAGSEMSVYKALQSNWSELFPEIPFEGGLQQDVWGFYFREIEIYKLVWRVFAFLAISLTMLGLYGLVRLNVDGRTKEFSIKKVLGASVKNILDNVTRPYLVLFVAALVVGAPLGHWAGAWLIDFSNEYHMPITISGAVGAVVITVLVLSATVSTQIWKVLRSNPVEGLKSE